jgi:hypothetical protein
MIGLCHARGFGRAHFFHRARGLGRAHHLLRPRDLPILEVGVLQLCKRRLARAALDRRVRLRQLDDPAA